MITKNFAVSIAVAIVAACAMVGARAQSVGNSNSLGQQSTSAASIAPGAVNVTLQGAQAAPATTTATLNYNGQPVAAAAPVYVNSPSPATCVNAGMGASLQTGTIGGAVAIGGAANVECDAREGAKTAKFLGLPDNVSREMLCAVQSYRDAMKRAGLPCLIDQAAAQQQRLSDAGPTDPFVRSRLGLPPL